VTSQESDVSFLAVVAIGERVYGVAGLTEGQGGGLAPNF